MSFLPERAIHTLRNREYVRTTCILLKVTPVAVLDDGDGLRVVFQHERDRELMRPYLEVIGGA